MRKKKLFYNTVISIANQIIAIICGFILPRLLLKTYGSEVNGLISSVTQFLGAISFMQLGVGAVVQSSLYIPLAKKDKESISKIYVSARKFFRKIALLFIVYILILTIIYPNMINTSFDFWYTASLILIISTSLFSQYFFGIVNQLLLNADQKAYIYLFVDVITLIISTIISIVLMKLDFSIQIVKTSTALIYILRSILVEMYVRRHYKIDKRIELTEEPISQKWNGFVQHMASTVMDNTDVIILTLFSSLNDVSIYYVYHLVVNGIRQMVTAFTMGLQSLFGNMLANNEEKKLKETFFLMEFLFHIIVTILFTCTLILIVPFILVYTNGIEDTNYNIPIFAIILVLSQAIYCYRIIYYIVIKAAGHYKQTQKSALIEMLINIVLSISLVLKYGLVGVAIGTLVAITYRTIYFIYYLSNNVLKINKKISIYRYLVDIISILICYVCTTNITITNYTYISWIVMAIKIVVICTLLIIAINYILNCTTINKLIKRFLIKNKYKTNNN